MSFQRVPLLQSPLLRDVDKEGPEMPTEHPQLETQDETLFDNPQFVHYEQTSNIQLFFDLFFVANLTTFTNQHEINSMEKLSSYIGFFCILWFTWCQVTLYDVRFATDSVFERICHALHFGVMVGLAVVGPQFDPDTTFWDTLQQLSFLLMASRFILFLQYGSTLYFVWRYKKTRFPLLLVMATLFGSAILYLGLSFAFSLNSQPNAYVAWYVVAVFEVGSNIAIAGTWHVLSFRFTHLVERMSCLTLIVLGEGVIGLTRSIAEIESHDFDFSGATIGTVIAAVLIIYLIYQLYFDNIQVEHFGTIRQQIWAFLHLPFHLALVLLMEGTNRFIIYRHIAEVVFTILNVLSSVTDDTDPSQVFTLLQNIANVTFETFPPTSNETGIMASINEDFSIISPSSNATENERDDATLNLLSALIKAVFDGYSFEPPETGVSESEDYDALINSYFKVFELIFGYFFICAGLVLIGIGILSFLVITGKPSSSSMERSLSNAPDSLEVSSEAKNKDARRISPRSLIGVVADVLLGLGLTLCSIMVVTDAADNLGSSPWTLPLVVFVLAIALVLNHWPTRVSGKRW